MLLQILAAWPLPDGAGMDDRLAHRLQDRLGAGKGRVAAADHEGQGARLGADDAARDRRVEHVEAGLGRRRGDQPRGLDIDRRAIDQQRALLAPRR